MSFKPVVNCFYVQDWIEDRLLQWSGGPVLIKVVEVDIKIVPGDAAWVPSGGHGQRGLRSIISQGDSEPGQEDVEVVINNMEFSALDMATDWERANGAANLLHRFGLME